MKPTNPVRPMLMVICAAILAAGGCVTSSPSGDYDFVRTVARGRAKVPRDIPTARRPDDDEPLATKLSSKPLTVESATRIAVLNNRALRADLYELGIARGELVQASLLPNPQFEVEVRFPQDDAQAVQWDLGVGVDLTSLILRGARENAAESNMVAARFRAAGAVLDLGYRVRLAFYNVQANAQRRDWLGKSLEAARAGFATAEEMHRAGNVTDLDLDLEEAAYVSSGLAVAEADADVAAARAELNVLLGLHGKDAEWVIEATLSEPTSSMGDLAGLESKAIEGSIELAEMRAAVDVTTRRRGLASAQGWLPNLNLGFHAEHDGAVWEVGPALSGNLPVFDRQQGDVGARDAEVQALRSRYLAKAVEIRATVQTAIARASSAERRALEYRDRMLPLRERVMRRTLLQYNAMQVGVFQLLQARRDQINTGTSYVSTLREYWSARATLDQLRAGRATGLGDFGDSARPNEQARVTEN